MDNENVGPIREDVLNADDVIEMVPKLRGHRKLIERMLHWLQVDEVNNVHRRWRSTPGPEFVNRMVNDDFHIKIDIKGMDVLQNLPEGAFITVSNHPFGALDGIVLIYLITRFRPKFKVMVNMILAKIGAMKPNFISVDAMASDDPAKRKVSMLGIREAIRQLKSGEPLGFFPAGAMSKITLAGKLEDREWQKSVLEIIARAKVPVIPIYFHGSNSWWFNLLGHICWPARSLRLPAEVFRKRNTTMTVSVGDPIAVEEQTPLASDPIALGKMLRSRTYALRSDKRPGVIFQEILDRK